MEDLYKPETERSIMVSAYAEENTKRPGYFKPQFIFTRNMDAYITRSA